MTSQTEMEVAVEAGRPDFCGVCCVEFKEISKHFETEKHVSSISAAKKYLKFCDENRISPVDCSTQFLRQFLDKISAGEYEKIRTFLDEIHNEFDGKTVSEVADLQWKPALEKSKLGNPLIIHGELTEVDD
jgi:hypothetical protein